MTTSRRPQSALPLSPLTKAEISVRHEAAMFTVAIRAGNTVDRLDRSQQRATASDTSWIFEAAREFSALDAALVVRFHDKQVAA
jgi:hypothetical protein